MCKLFHDECENPQFDIPKIDKLYKLTEYWLNQVKSSFEEFNENIKNISEQKTVNDNNSNISVNKELKNDVAKKIFQVFGLIYGPLLLLIRILQKILEKTGTIALIMALPKVICTKIMIIALCRMK